MWAIRGDGVKAVGRERNFATWIQQRIFELENTASNYRRIGQCVSESYAATYYLASASIGSNLLQRLCDQVILHHWHSFSIWKYPSTSFTFDFPNSDTAFARLAKLLCESPIVQLEMTKATRNSPHFINGRAALPLIIISSYYRRTPDNSHKCLRQNRTNFGHFDPRGWGSDGQNSQLGWCKSNPGSDKEACQHMEVRSTFGQGPLAERNFFDELWELWVTLKRQCLVNRGNALIGSVFGQIGPTGWEVSLGRFRTKMPKFRKICPDKNGRFWEILGSNIVDYQGSYYRLLGNCRCSDRRSFQFKFSHAVHCSVFSTNFSTNGAGLPWQIKK